MAYLENTTKGLNPADFLWSRAPWLGKGLFLPPCRARRCGEMLPSPDAHPWHSAPPGGNPGAFGARLKRRHPGGFGHGLKRFVASLGGSQLGEKAKPHAPSPGTNSTKPGRQLHPNLWRFMRCYLIVGVNETAEEEAAFS